MHAASMTVTIPAAVCDDGAVLPICECVISAACPRCGNPRGTPILQLSCDAVSGHFCCIDAWHNPCGHADAYEDVHLEVALQCAHYPCVTPASVEHYPHCSPECAHGDLWHRVWTRFLELFTRHCERTRR